MGPADPVRNDRGVSRDERTRKLRANPAAVSADRWNWRLTYLWSIEPINRGHPKSVEGHSGATGRSNHL